MQLRFFYDNVYDYMIGASVDIDFKSPLLKKYIAFERGIILLI